MNERRNPRDTVLAILLSVAAISMYGCNTVEGFGRDVEKLGDTIEKKAEQKKHY